MNGLQERINTVATWFLQQGLSVIPLGDEKKPAIKWGEHIDKPLKNWNFPGCNIALLTGEFNGLCVIDCDSEDAYIGWLKTKPGTPLRVRTKRGMQFYYRHPGQYVKSDAHIKDPAGFEYDVKGDRSYVVAPPSVRDGYQYQFVVCSSNIRGKFIPFNKLPAFNPEWRPEHKPVSSKSDSCPFRREPQGGNGNRVLGGTPAFRDGTKYIQHIRAVEGSGGDKDTYRAACVLIQSGMDEYAAYHAMLDWNKTNADPPWEPWQLKHKVERAMESVTA